ncbi:nucleotidyltransferase family protein [bacterium]|nr:nucleotidyltransferase family protein [bacterium]
MVEHETNLKISLILMSAGTSQRMKECKQLMKIPNGDILAEYTLKKYLQFPFDEIIVVLGREKEKLQNIFKKYDVKTVYNENYINGIGTSVACGVKNLSKNSNACMMALADMPKISLETISKLINFYKTNQENIIIPTLNDKRGNPTIFPSRFYIELQKLNADKGGSIVIKNNPKFVKEIEVETDEIFFDIDNKEVWENFVLSF